MTSHMRIYLPFLLIVLFGLFAQPALAAVFEVHIFYDASKQNLHLDEKASDPVSLNEDKDLPIPDFDQMFPGPGPFEFLFFDSSGDRIEDKQFSPQQGSSVIDVPYYSAATKFVLKKTGSEDVIDSVDIGRFSQCNRNGICEFEKGETIATCLTDCTSGNFSEETEKLLKQDGGVIKDPKSGEILLRGIQPSATSTAGAVASSGDDSAKRILLIVGAVAVILISVGVFVIFRLRARNRRYGL